MARQLSKRRDAILAGGLRGVQRLIAGAQERRRLRAVERVRRDTRRDLEREAGIGEAVGEQRADLAAQSLGGVRARAREHDDELVATDASGLGVLRQRAHEDVGDLAQQRVAELVPGAVVDLLEVVAVDHEEAQRESSLLRVQERELESFLEPAPVEDACERVRRGAQPLALERERRIERRSDVRCQDGCRVEHGRVHALGGAADAHQRADVAGVGAEW